MLLACSLAKAHQPRLDIRKPYTEIADDDAYSGRAGYDERYIDEFVREHRLPCNATTAWLTPAWRNIKAPLTREVDLVGRPRAIYRYTIDLLNDVYEGRYSAEDLLTETTRRLLILRNEEQLRMESLVTALSIREDAIPLSSEHIVTLIQQHMASRRASRLLVLVVAAAYQSASAHLAERVLTLHSHNAADKQTGALGDVEITLVGDNDVLTSYEMKDRPVTHGDISNAVTKVSACFGRLKRRIDNYIFITTKPIDQEVQAYAVSLYEQTGGVEFVILDCIGFLRHFLHLFHRVRMQFLEAYQRLVLDEPDSAVSQPLKELLLALRRAAESQLADNMTPTNEDE
jgi:DNA adenine methylase